MIKNENFNTDVAYCGTVVTYQNVAVIINIKVIKYMSFYFIVIGAFDQ